MSRERAYAQQRVGEQVLTLSFRTQCPVGPVDDKGYCPPPKKKKLMARFFLFKKTLCFAIHRIASRMMQVWPLFILPLVIYFHVFSQYFVWQTMLLQESFENQMPSVEAAADRVLRTTGDAAACISSYSWLYSKIRRANRT